MTELCSAWISALQGYGAYVSASDSALATLVESVSRVLRPPLLRFIEHEEIASSASATFFSKHSPVSQIGRLYVTYARAMQTGTELAIVFANIAAQDSIGR